MKKLTAILGITLLSGLLAVPVIAWSQGWGRGHMMGCWDRGPGAYDQNDRGYASTLSREQQERMTDLDRKFYDETRELRDKLQSKSAELNTALAETSPDAVKATRIQKEISDLRTQLDEKMVAYEIEARKIAPDARFGGGYGYGRMMGGYGGARGYGMGPGTRGYGPGACWND